jgi:hypothetical protein
MEHSDITEFKERSSILINEHKWTIAKIANKVGVHNTVVVYILKDKRKPQPKTIAKIKLFLARFNRGEYRIDYYE